MTTVELLLFSAVAVLVAAAFWVRHTQSPTSKYRRGLFAIVAASAAVSGAVFLARAEANVLASTESQWFLLLPATGVWSLLVCAMGLATVLASPAASWPLRTLPAALRLTAASLLVLTAQPLWLLAAGWLLGPAALVGARPLARLDLGPSHDVRGRWGQTARLYLLWGSLPVVGAALLALSTLPAGHHLGRMLEADLPQGPAAAVAWLLTVGALIRMGAFPFQSWVPALLDRAPLGPAALLVGAQSGVALLYRAALPLAERAGYPQLAQALLPLALVTAIYGALVALAQPTARRALAFVAVSQASIAMAGLATSQEVGQNAGQEAGVWGALAQAQSLGVAVVGLTLLSWGLVARFGTDQFGALGGVARRMPRGAALFLLIAILAAGFPGGLAFLAEDLVIQSTIVAHPVVVLALLSAMALNAWSLLRGFMRLYFGSPEGFDPHATGGAGDLLLRERIVFTAIAGLLLLPGIFPQLFLSAIN